ncbi:TetR/AcrR family transcriptional regulator [Tsukamurella soli]|uniref:HTH tetR-type domain-containing protein n=1 Tax=Tsukamurella soli TaxID=644556 RepID=A0ABP8JS70_9ACTN
MTIDGEPSAVKTSAAKPTERVRNRRGNGVRLREEILDAAVVLIDETEDAAALTLRGIARRAGISAPSIYPHFAELATLIEAVLARSFDELRDAVQSAIDAEDTPRDALMAAGRAYVQFGWDHKARYRLMFAATGYAANAVDTFTVVESTIQECVEAGVSTSTDPHIDAWLLWASLHGVATLAKPARADYLRLGPLDRPAMLRTLISRIAGLVTG